MSNGDLFHLAGWLHMLFAVVVFIFINDLAATVAFLALANILFLRADVRDLRK